MSNEEEKEEKTQVDIAWEKLFEKYHILQKIEEYGVFEISASQIKEFHEARLMAKFDHILNLPTIFSDNNLAILPTSRGDYIISHFNAYHEFEPEENHTKVMSIPGHIQSLSCYFDIKDSNYNKIPSEAIALNCAVAAGIINDFLEENIHLFATVSGRMGSGNFEFDIQTSNPQSPVAHIQVNNSQIEIDAAYEGTDCLALLEAKKGHFDDFLIRQLYYPYRTWKDKITKKVRMLFLTYSNGIFRVYEYDFRDPDNYNSLVLIKQKNYSIEETMISAQDIQNVLSNTKLISEPQIPFPQADSFERVINLCELLHQKVMSRDDITEQYGFDVRQTSYYTTAALYLGLIEKQRREKSVIFCLSQLGEQIAHLSFKQRQLAYCDLILSHKVFHDVLQAYFKKGELPDVEEIVSIMKNSSLYNIDSDNTFERRSSTVKGWINWIVGLINEDV